MPKCISCNEVYADQLRRCPHCGYTPEAESRDGAGARRRHKARRSRGRHSRTIRLAVLSVLLAGGGLGAVIAFPRAADQRLDGDLTYVPPGEEPPIDLPEPDEIEAGRVSEGFQVTGTEIVGDRVLVTGTCSPRAIVRVLVDRVPAVLNAAADRFSALVPLGDGTVEVVAEGILGDRATLTRGVTVEAVPAPGEQVRMLSLADGSTVHETRVKVTYAPLRGGSPRQQEIALTAIENRIRIEGSTFTIYWAPEGLTFLRRTPEGTYAFLREADEQEMILVPAGIFPRGMGDGPPDGPRHLVQVTPYLIDRTEVTCAQYARFLEYMHRVDDFSKRHVEDPNVTLVPVGWTSDDPPPGRAAYPVTGVSWYASYAYARWAGGRLPTEAEWERAACADGRPYPCGTDFREDWVCWQVPGPMPADSLPGGAGPYGLLHMSGNVREWCLDRFDPRWYLIGARVNPRGSARTMHRVVRGGSYCSPAENLRAQRRDNLDPVKKDADLGFRVARNWNEPKP